jgi:predicted restriction endonuclease
MFDRFLFTVNDDHTLRVPKTHSSDLPRGLVVDGQPLRLPSNAQQRPHPRFLSWHQGRFKTKHGLGA